MLSKVTSKGQISIPTEVRKASGIDLGDYVDLEVKDGKVVLTPKLFIDKPRKMLGGESRKRPAKK